ncbi:DUF4396 domain-containing protein [Jiella avicenniae]|uniref:DUF4396 domain-containing protein n=1 Tax=Jiella avicenniae TaxID=2907202 RepID=A0A9X1NZR4_9HYPH|nr:DUF4396 domain-containing protein [Jiella avicenniae]MCE7027346.1 DUF4396 domain-containing protein [Jiella avicenniae]
MIPTWLHVLAIVALVVGALSALYILIDTRRDPQHMAIMNVVWPITGLYAGPLAVWAYRKWGKLAAHSRAMPAMEADEPMPSKTETPHYASVGKGAAHCGAGCTLGDICAEWLAFLIPAIAVWFGWQSLFSEKIFAVWILDYILAFGFGIVFQYFAIKPMNEDMSPGQGIVAALKADTLSLTSWQVGMYGFMAIAHFWIFGSLIGVKLEVDSVEFWFMMQIAMLCGFLTAYPVNIWLIDKGIKEAM